MYIARQPILDRDGRIAGFELLFREASGPVRDGQLASANVAMKAFADTGLGDLLGAHRGFVNVDGAFLDSDLVEFLPPARCVLEILETVEYTPARIERCKALKAMGYTLAADDYAGHRSAIEPVLALLDIVKVDVQAVAGDAIERTARELAGKTLLAEKVETHGEAERCRTAGYALFQGYYFARPERVTGTEMHGDRLAALGVLALIARDADDDAILQALMRHPTLVVGLLRRANAAGTGLGKPIGSLRQALFAIGKRPLALWLQLVVYVGSGSGDPAREPLLQVAAVRAKVMESLALRCGGGSLGESAFVAGLVSLFDCALDLTQAEIARRLALDDAIRDALCERSGDIGALLTLAEAMERADDAGVQRALRRLPGLDQGMLAGASRQALSWAASLG